MILPVFLLDIFKNAKALKSENEPENEPEKTEIDHEKLKAELEALKQKLQQNHMKEGNENEENV